MSIKAFKQYDGESQVTLVLVNEGGKWVVDDFITIENGKKYSEKSYLADYVKELQSKPKEENLDWLQGHWVYEQGNYKGHFIIQGNSITQYSSMNPERYEATYRIEGDELRAKLIDGMDLTVKIDFASNGGIYIDNDYAGVVSVLTYNSTSALLRYRGGAYREGKIAVTMDGNGRMRLTDPVDGTVWYQK